MAMTINTNVVSLNSQRNLGLSGGSLAASMQRLSSGLRVNSAKDDAAGLAIAERMNAQTKGLAVAARNANDGISLAQTAEGALGKVGDMLQRMRELAVQASNATNSASDRKALQAEVSQLAAEIDRVAKQTNFNGQKILDGSFAGAVFQVGANSGDNVTLGALADTRSSQVSNINYAANKLVFNVSDADPLNPAISKFNQPIGAGELKIQVGDLPAIELSDIDAANSSLERIGQVITAINNKTADTGVTAYMTLVEGTQNYEIAFMSSKLDDTGAPSQIRFTGFNTETTGIGGLLAAQTITATSAYTAIDSADTSQANFNNDTFSELAAAFKKDSAYLPVSGALTSAFSDYEANPSYTTATALKTSITNSVAAYNGKATFDAISSPTKTEAVTYINLLEKAAGVATGDLSKEADFATPAAALEKVKELEASAGFQTSLDIIDPDTQFKINQRGVDDIDVTTQAGAWIALKKIDSAIDQINGARATLGAMQTRFETAVNNIDIQVENLSAARGRIVDADFAVETANLSRTQILQQAGTAMVAQANQIPQNVLQLLQG